MHEKYRDYLVNKINKAYYILSLVEELTTESPHEFDSSKLGEIGGFVNGIIWKYNQQLSKYDYEQSKKEVNNE